MLEIKLVEDKERGCGRRHRGMYAKAGDGEGGGIVVRFVAISPPIPYQVKLHRGPRLVDDDALLNRQAMNEWWVGSSRDTEKKKAGDQWAIDTFGMTITKRVTTGVCVGAKTADDAMEILSKSLTWSNKVLHWFGVLGEKKFQELPRCSTCYANLYESLRAFVESKNMGDLLKFQANVWKAAYNVPPSKRQDYIPVLMRMQILLGVPDDAKAMQQTFLQ